MSSLCLPHCASFMFRFIFNSISHLCANFKCFILTLYHIEKDSLLPSRLTKISVFPSNQIDVDNKSIVKPMSEKER